ncbi:echinoderm microtubule-associated protein-like 4 isoform X2 [Acanthaster planci]|uniref:Echinoderm microtubule-associated protein-like 4 isoform X2 n=1 Tax=Acanthaster planci TaxID=133434 RepID=A0A8B7Z4P1_ACAPL|nr:echinoderm microtubule-associated protein-like 4 isoform X2 [Acanthaster planci]
MMSMRTKQRPSQTSISGPSRYDRMAAPGHIHNMNSKINWSEFVEEREQKNGNQLPAIPGGSGLNNSFRKRTPQSTADLTASDRFTILPEIEGIDIDKELRESLSGPLKDVSRQRLRAIKISFRRLSNTDNRISTKDALVVLGEHNVKISNRTYQMMVRKFETDRGMDIESLWRYMAEAQASTGRDSIQAINQNKQTTSQPLQQLNAEDIALLTSINKALKSSNEYDLEEMRTVCQMRDISRQGSLPRKMFRRICLDQHLPLGATLMRTLLKRCADEKNGLIGWPEFLMLLEKGMNFDADQYKIKKKPSSAINKRQQSQKKPSSPKASALLSPNDVKVKDSKDTGKADHRIRPRSPNSAVSQEAKQKDTSTSSTAKALDVQGTESSNSRTTATPSRSKSPELPLTKQGSKIKEPKESSKVGEKLSVKSSDPSGQKIKTKDQKDRGKPKTSQEAIKLDEDVLSVKNLPTQRKSKVITWNDPITLSAKADQLSASASVTIDQSPSKTDQIDQDQTPSAKEGEVCKSPLPSDKTEVIQAGDSGQTVEPTDSVPNQADGSLLLSETVDVGDSAPSHNPDMDPTEEEYLKREQERINRVGSELTLNEPSLDNASMSSDPKEETYPLVDPDTSAASLAPAERSETKTIEVDLTLLNAKDLSDERQDFEGSETSSIFDREDTDTQSITSVSLSTKSKVQKQHEASEKRMRAIYGKNPRRQLTPLGKRMKDNQKQPHRATNPGKASSTKKSVLKKTPKPKSSVSSRGGSANNKDHSAGPVSAPADELDLPEHGDHEPDPETKSVVSQSAMDSQGNILPKSHSSASLNVSATHFPDDGDLLSQHLQVETANDPSHGGTSPPALPDKVPTEEVESQPDKREEDGEKSTFTIRGQQMSYYVPDAYVGKELPTDAPSQILELNWIYGYRGNDCRCNMYVIEDGILAYFIGKVVVLYSTQEHKQRHYTLHTAEIKSLAVHSSNIILASGQMAGPEDSNVQACIHVWSAETLETLYVAGEGYFEKAVLCVSFCKEEDYLVAVDDNEEHTMSVWHSSSGERLAEKVLLTEVVCQVAFHPTHPHQLVSIGKEHLCFWKLQKEPYTIEETMIANYETKMKAKYVICLTFHPNGALLTGDSNGTIYLWHKDGNTIAHTITHAHNGPVFWMMYVRNTLISGGRDGIIQTYSLSSKGTEFTGKMQLPSVEGGVRTIQTHRKTMYIGTTLNCILSANISLSGSGSPIITGATVNNAPITQGHYDEVRCIAPHPVKKDHFFTAAYDGIVCLYDAALHKAIWKYVVKGINSTCMDVGPDGEIIIIGAKDGHKGNSMVVLTVGEEEVQETNRIKLGRHPVSFIKFAPGGEVFAASCGDIILILKATDTGRKIEPMGKCEGHQTPVTGFDWSKEEISGRLVLQSSSLSQEYICWDTQNFQALSCSSDYRNITWKSHNCTAGFTVAGVWETDEDSHVVRSIDWSEERDLLATGLDNGVISLHRYPCTIQLTARKSVHAHSMAVPCVRFLPDTTTFLSAGGSDCSTIQWSIQS